MPGKSPFPTAAELLEGRAATENGATGRGEVLLACGPEPPEHAVTTSSSNAAPANQSGHGLGRAAACGERPRRLMTARYQDLLH